MASFATSGQSLSIATTGSTKSIPNVTGNVPGSVTITPVTGNTASGFLGTETSTRGDNTPMWGT